ncbi:MAG: hypothetical protein PHX51_07305 [Clostridia bacterium]|nr:hypothetical protein [Clostridia bacterium]
MRKILVIVLLLSVSLMLTSCLFMLMGYTYKGDYPDLFTVSVNSIIGTFGWTNHGSSKIEVLETDNYGRILFTYDEIDNAYFEISTSILVCQLSLDGYVYYYPDVNVYTIKSINKLSDDRIVYSSDHFAIAENRNAIKEANDWNKPLALDKCTKKSIDNKKQDIPNYFTEDAQETLFHKLNPDMHDDLKYSSMIDFSVLTTDDYGRTVYQMLAICHRSPNGGSASYSYLVLEQPDGTYSDTYFIDCSMYIGQEGTYYCEDYTKWFSPLYDDLVALKKANNWNQPF